MGESGLVWASLTRASLSLSLPEAATEHSTEGTTEDIGAAAGCTLGRTKP